jgi:hypothetical protein
MDEEADAGVGDGMGISLRGEGPEPSHDFVENAGFRFGFALLVQEDAKLAGGRTPVGHEIRSGQSHRDLQTQDINSRVMTSYHKSVK